MWLTILAAFSVPLERLFTAHSQPIWRRGIVTDLGDCFLSSLLPAVLLSFPISLLSTLVPSVMPADFLLATASLTLWARALVGLVASEIGYYPGHR